MPVEIRKPRLTFGIIVLNGEPFIKYCLRQLYPHAHQIIVVEGGSRKAALFAPDGHSTDGTRESLEAFKAEEDPENKLIIVTKEGFWEEKDEQSRAYAELATGDYLWQVDVDEFYRHEDVEKVRNYLAENPEVSAISFRQRPFFGGIQYSFDSYNLRADNTSEYHRLFRWEEGYKYLTHRPPTVVDSSGVNLREKSWLTAKDTESLGVTLYHYSLLLPKQVRDKCAYYENPGDDPSKAHAPGIVEWANECYFKLKRPYRVHNVFNSVSWLERYDGPSPEEIENMWSDIALGKINVELRPHGDIEELLAKKRYQLTACFLSSWATLFRRPLFNFIGRSVAWMTRRVTLIVRRVATTMRVK